MKINNHSLLFMVLIIFSTSISLGQQLTPIEELNKSKPINPEFCGTDFLHNQKMNDDPAYRKRYIESLEANKKFISKQNKKAARGRVKIYKAG